MIVAIDAHGRASTIRPIQRMGASWMTSRRAIVSAWYGSRDGEAWTPATVTWGYWWRAPQPTGPLYLKAVWTTAAGHTSESILELTIDKRPGRY